jgi:hypothetical protein
MLSASPASWGHVAAPTPSGPMGGGAESLGRRGKLLYTPMLLVDQASGAHQPVWTDGTASLPVGSRPTGWYPSQSRTYTSGRLPPILQRDLIEKGSADSLVESVSPLSCRSGVQQERCSYGETPLKDFVV